MAASFWQWYVSMIKYLTNLISHIRALNQATFSSPIDMIFAINVAQMYFQKNGAPESIENDKIQVSQPMAT